MGITEEYNKKEFLETLDPHLKNGLFSIYLNNVHCEKISSSPAWNRIVKVLRYLNVNLKTDKVNNKTAVIQ